MNARLSTPVQTGPGTYPASCTMGKQVIPSRGKIGQDVALHTHPHLAPTLKKKNAIPLLPVCAFMNSHTLEAWFHRLWSASHNSTAHTQQLSMWIRDNIYIPKKKHLAPVSSHGFLGSPGPLTTPSGPPQLLL